MKNILMVLFYLEILKGIAGRIDRNFGNTLNGCIEPRKLNPHYCSSDEFYRYRTITGVCNNLLPGNATVGSSGIIAPRLLNAKYFDQGLFQEGDHLDTPLGHPSLPDDVGVNVKSAQDISDTIFDISDIDYGNGKVSNVYMTFGQFLDHEFALITHERACGQGCDISAGDFDDLCFPISRKNKPNQCVGFGRSFPVCQGETRVVREQVNNLTAYIDGSVIYGSTEYMYKKIRNGSTPYLAVNRTKDNGDLLPFNGVRSCNDKCFLAGDRRVNENAPLAAMHTIWVRLHNYYAREIESLGEKHPSRYTSISKSTERHERNTIIFEEARNIVIAILQHIVYEEWLVKLVDLSPYNGYNPNVKAEISNEFQTAAFRFGHTLIPNKFERLHPDFTRAHPPLSLRDAFFNNQPILTDGIEPIMFGLLGNKGEAEEYDTTFSASIGKKLFVPRKKRGFHNLLALNIQRGRDHGLESYTEYRKYCGIPNSDQVGDNPFTVFRNEIQNTTLLNDFQKAYDHPQNYIDLFAGGIAESKYGNKLLGRTFGCIIKKTFEDLRDGDRFFYKNHDYFSSTQQKEIEKMTLAKVMCLTLRNVDSIQENVFDQFNADYHQRINCKTLIEKNLNVENWLSNSKIQI